MIGMFYFFCFFNAFDLNNQKFCGCHQFFSLRGNWVFEPPFFLSVIALYTKKQLSLQKLYFSCTHILELGVNMQLLNEQKKIRKLNEFYNEAFCVNFAHLLILSPLYVVSIHQRIERNQIVSCPLYYSLRVILG